MDDIQIILTFLTILFTNLFTVYKMFNSLNSRIGRLEGKLESVEKTLNLILDKMLNGDDKC